MTGRSGSQMISMAKRLSDEALRSASARATRMIARRYGDSLGMWLGCGYPKSGTVWLCQLLSSYLDLPHPRRYRMPVAMPCVVHSHGLPDPRLPRTVYVVRDGRDVMVSLYFYEVRLASSDLNPRAAHMRQERFKRVLGPKADLQNIRANLPRFLEAEMESPAWMHSTWKEHVEAWLAVGPDRACMVRYEDLLLSVETALTPVLEQLTGLQTNAEYLRLAADRFDFERQSKSSNELVQRSPALRKGISGDWKNFFTPESEEIFDDRAGGILEVLGYPRSSADASDGRKSTPKAG